MIRWVVGLVAAVVAALLNPPPPGVAMPMTPAVAVYAYDSPGYESVGTTAATERGPPAAHDHSVTTYDVVDRRSHGAAARQDEAAIPTAHDYDRPSRLAKVARGSRVTEGPAGDAEPSLVVFEPASVAAKAGPGAWGTAAESMSSRAAAYQARVTGGAAGPVYRVGGVKFDGFANGVLQEAKGPGYAKFVRNGQFQPWFSGADGLASQAQRQLAAAGGTPITWSVAESQAATAINNLFMSRGISGINVMYVP